MKKKLFQTLLIGASVLQPGINLTANSSSTATVTNDTTGVSTKIYPGENGNPGYWSFSCTNTSGCSFKISGNWISPKQPLCPVNEGNSLWIKYSSNVPAVIKCNVSVTENLTKKD